MKSTSTYRPTPQTNNTFIHNADSYPELEDDFAEPPTYNPLTHDEITLYSKLESSGALKNILNSPGTESTPPLLDQNFQTAFEALNASTTAIQRQTEILTSQCENLHRQIRLEDEREGVQARDIARLRQKHESGRQNTAAASSDLSHDLEVRLKSESDKVTMEGKQILSALAGRLKEDDRLLVNLERLASGIKSTNDDASIIVKTSNLGILLAQHVSEEIQFRLDRLYLETVQTARGDASFGHPEIHEDEAVVVLAGEMDSLYAEIDILAEMSSKQQFSESILRELQHHHGQSRIASHNKLDYISDSMAEMTLSTLRLTKVLKDRESFCGALECFASTYRAELGDQFSEQSSARRETFKRRSTAGSTKPSPGSHVIALPESQAFASLLRRIGLPFESVFQPEEADGGAQALYEKREHMAACLRDYSIAADSPLAAETLSTDQAGCLLSSSLHTTSHFETSLSDMDHDRRLAKLEFQLDLIQNGIGRLDLDAIYRRDKKGERFLEMWSQVNG